MGYSLLAQIPYYISLFALKQRVSSSLKHSTVPGVMINLYFFFMQRTPKNVLHYGFAQVVNRDFKIYDAVVNDNTTKQQCHWLIEEKLMVLHVDTHFSNYSCGTLHNNDGESPNLTF